MSVDIVNLIENNPITKLNGNYHEKVKNSFTEYEQQIFLIKHFKVNLDYKKSLLQSEKPPNVKGGHNKEIFMLNINKKKRENTIKRICNNWIN